MSDKTSEMIAMAVNYWAQFVEDKKPFKEALTARVVEQLGHVNSCCIKSDDVPSGMLADVCAELGIKAVFPKQTATTIYLAKGTVELSELKGGRHKRNLVSRPLNNALSKVSYEKPLADVSAQAAEAAR